MTEELFDKAVAEGNPVCYYLFKDLGIDKGCKYFVETGTFEGYSVCLLYTSPSPRDQRGSRMPSSA